MRFVGRFGLHMSGADVAMLRTDLFDLWFQPDEMDEPVVFRREGDPESLVRLLFSQRFQGLTHTDETSARGLAPDYPIHTADAL